MDDDAPVRAVMDAITAETNKYREGIQKKGEEAAAALKKVDPPK